MSVYYHPFDIRWSDLDANFHLGNSVYVEYCAHARMAFMQKNGLSLKALSQWGIGPVILHERLSFFKEIHFGQEIFVSVEINGVSEDGGIYRFEHKFYSKDGMHRATAEAIGVWIDTKIRKSTVPNEEIVSVMENFKSKNCSVLTKEDLKNLPFKPENIDPSQLLNQEKCSN